MSYNSKYTGQEVEQLLDQVQTTKTELSELGSIIENVSLLFEDNSYINLQGQLANTSSNCKATSNYYDCRGKDVIVIDIWLKKSWNMTISFYDEDNSFLSAYQSDEDKFTTHVIKVPQDARYYRVCGFFYNVSVSDVKCITGSWGNSIYDMLMGENYRINGDISYNEDGCISSCPVIWSDGTPGLYTATNWYETAKMYCGYEITYGDKFKVVQPGCSLNADFTIKKISKLKIQLL